MRLKNEDDDYVKDVQGTEDIVLHYFENKFTPTKMVRGVDVLNSMQQRVTPEMNERLDRSFSEEEIKVVVFQMQPSKTPGPDGMTLFFYQRFWPNVGKDITLVIQSFISSRKLLKRSTTPCGLSPKTKCSQNMT